MNTNKKHTKNGKRKKPDRNGTQEIQVEFITAKMG